MPRQSFRPCTYPGCNRLTRNGRCEKHPSKDHRAAQRAAMYDGRYRRIRNRYIAAHPVCEIQEKCNGAPATEVDHIKPISAGGAVHDESNLQSVCAPCHRWKTKHVDGFTGHFDRTNYC